MLILQVTYKLHPRVSSDEYLFEIEENHIIEESRRETGNVMYDFYLPTDGAHTTVVLVGVWTDEAALAEHKASVHYSKLTDIKNKIVRQTEVRWIASEIKV